MRVALLTGGGDCPGLNAVIYAAVRKGINHYGDEFIGFLNGWRGVLDNNFIPLTLENIDGIQLKGGTILHSSRTNVKKIPGGIDKVQEVLKTQQDRRADRPRRRRHAVGHAVSQRERRTRRGRAQDHRQRHQRHRRRPSATTPQSRSPPRPSTASTPPPTRTTA